MKVVICGAGQVGWQIARHLSSEKNDVTVVDNNAELVARAMDTLDVSGVCGSASYPDVLAAAGAENADMIIAATYSDEVNMVTCQVAHSVFRIPRKIARLRAKSYLDVLYSDLYQRDHMPIDVVISPEREVAKQALMQFSSPQTFDVEPFLEGRAELMGLSLDADCSVLNTPLSQFSELFSTLRMTIMAIRRNRELFVPEDHELLRAGDEIYICTHDDDKERCLEVFGKSTKKQERVIIIGGGTVGRTIAQNIEEMDGRMRAKIIEYDRAVAEELADSLSHSVVLHGDGLSNELLEEANIKNCDGILAVTNDDKTNVLAAARAKSEGAPLAIALVNDSSLTSLKDALGIDAMVNPKTTTVSSILRHIRHGRVRAVYSIGDAEAEVIEAQVLASSPITGTLISDIRLPQDAKLALIEKNGQIMRPKGNMRIDEGDVMVIFTMSNSVEEVEQLFQVQIDFF